MPPVKIAFVIDRVVNETSGTEKQLLEIIRRLDKTRFEPILICLSDSEYIRTSPQICQTIVLKYSGFLKPNFPKEVGRLRSALEENNVQLVQTFFEDSIFVSLMACSKMKPRPVLLTSRRDIGLGKGVPWYHRLFDLVRPAAMKNFDGVLTNAEAVKNFVSETDHVPNDRVWVVYNGLDLAVDTLPPPRDWDKKAGDFNLAMTANLNPVKRHEIFIQALSLLKQKEPHLRFRAFLLGQGVQKPLIENLVKKAGLESHVFFEGPVGNVPAYLSRVQAGVLCSRREGLSNAVLEYMKHGLPVVATKVGGNPELVSEENGFLLEEGDSEGMAHAFQRLAREPGLADKLGLASRDKAVKLFSWEKSLSELEGLYENLLKKREAETKKV